MDKRLRKALLKEDYLTTAKLLKQGMDLGLDDYSPGVSPTNRGLTNTEMADLAREGLGASGLPKTAFTLLRRAAEANCVALVAVLLGKGLDPNRRDEFGDPLWHSAILRDARQVMAYLLKHGLDPKDGTPVESRKEPYTMMEHAVRRGSPRIVKLLLKYGVDPYVFPNESPQEQEVNKSSHKLDLKWRVLEGKPTRAQALTFFRRHPKSQGARKQREK